MSDPSLSGPGVPDLLRDRVDAAWCLFLDRDGVINRRIVDGYVRSWSQFEFLPGAVDAVSVLSRSAPYVVILTNQQGVGKGLVAERDLDDVHRRMSDVVAADGGRVDDVRWCPHLAAQDCACRKPAAGLALSWLAEHPEVDGSLSVMVGDTDSDMMMADNVASVTGGCARIGIGGEVTLAEVVFDTLAAFAAAITPGTPHLRLTP